jgi:vancomycin resistance protein YoaR
MSIPALLLALMLAAPPPSARQPVVKTAVKTVAKSAAPRIPQGVSLAGIPVGGLTRKEAEAKLQVWSKEALQKPVYFVTKSTPQKWKRTQSEAGMRLSTEKMLDEAFAQSQKAAFWERFISGTNTKARPVNIPARFTFSEAVFEKTIDKIASEVSAGPQDAIAKISPRGTLTIARRDTPGLTLNRPATKAQMAKPSAESIADDLEINLVFDEKAPRLTAERLGQMKVLLGSYCTDYLSSIPNRKHNVETAAKRINGRFLLPNEVFSYNQTLGPREQSTGWRSAPMMVAGGKIDSFGGGICQCSSTLYNAVLFANLKVVQRRNHSRKVNYVVGGRDATVSWGDIDFQFQNTTGGVIYIAAYADGDLLRVHLYGEQEPQERVIDLISSDPEDKSLFPTLSKVIRKADGTTITQRLYTDKYNPAVVDAPKVAKALSTEALKAAAAEEQPKKEDRKVKLGPILPDKPKEKSKDKPQSDKTKVDTIKTKPATPKIGSAKTATIKEKPTKKPIRF